RRRARRSESGSRWKNGWGGAPMRRRRICGASCGRTPRRRGGVLKTGWRRRRAASRRGLKSLMRSSARASCPLPPATSQPLLQHRLSPSNNSPLTQPPSRRAPSICWSGGWRRRSGSWRPAATGTLPRTPPLRDRTPRSPMSVPS
ncbi:unnamed protein product, partial [Phaeothamnion confervicola]